MLIYLKKQERKLKHLLLQAKQHIAKLLRKLKNQNASAEKEKPKKQNLYK